LTGKFVVCAVGGYGRRELFPFSDVDLIILFETEAGLDGSRTASSDFNSTLWDGGLRASPSVRTINECCELHDQNIELHISLLDLRFIYGNAPLFEALQQRLAAFNRKNSTLLARHLAELTRQRHSKFNNTVFHLEPNIKDAPGGIRDIHVLRWLAQLAPAEPTNLTSETAFLFRLRWFLHARAERDDNLLSFEAQDEAARLLSKSPLAPEDWMRLYFQSARPICQQAMHALEATESGDSPLLRQFRDWRGRLSTSEFTVSRERVFLRNAPETLSTHEGLFRLFNFVARHGVPLSWDAHRRVESARPATTRLFESSPAAWPLWRELLALPHAGLALQEMQDTGVLSAALPEWRSIDSLVVRDFYHRYTVDEHTLVALRIADDVLASKPDTPTRFHDFLVEPDEQAILRLSLLLHDVGKGTLSGDHVTGSLAVANSVLDRMQAPDEVRRAVVFLIQHHLDLSLVMNGRDIDDPATARFLSSRIRTLEDLRRLTLLTYCDIAAVNATSMTPWRIEQLWRVYGAGSEQLVRELETNRIHEGARDLPLWAEQDQELESFLEGFPKRYLLTHRREDITRHLELEKMSRREGVAVEVTREAGAYVLTVVAPDQPGLFGALCGALAGFGMNIVKAEAAANAAGKVLDFFRFTDPMRTLELNPGEVDRLQWTVGCVVKHTIEVSDLLKRRRAPRPRTETAITPSVMFNNDASDSATLIEFVGQDRPGLLYDLSSAISNAGCNIELVMIDTEAHKALDVFYVTRAASKLDDASQEQLKREILQAATKA
jgi:[protein-PII] uridylyltransferase